MEAHEAAPYLTLPDLTLSCRTGDPEYGADLSNSDPNTDNIYGGTSTGGTTWAPLRFTEMWVQMGNYEDNF